MICSLQGILISATRDAAAQTRAENTKSASAFEYLPNVVRLLLFLFIFCCLVCQFSEWIPSYDSLQANLPDSSL